MSIRTNPVKAVPLLLRRLVAIEKHENVGDLKSMLINIKDLFSTVKKNEEELLDTLTTVDGYIRNFDIRKLMEEKKDICERIRISTQKLLPAAATQSKIEEEPKTNENMHGAPFQVQLKDIESFKNMHGAPFLGQLEDIESFEVKFGLNDPPKHHCLNSLLLHFPERAVMKKMHIVYWWASVLGLDLFIIQERLDKDIFDYFLNHKLIVPQVNGKNPLVNKFIINHWIHDKLVTPFLEYKGPYCRTYSQIIASSEHHESNIKCLALDQQNVQLSDEFGFKSNRWRAIFNISSNYLKFGPQWMAKKDKLEVLHLGRWQDSASYHIEVASEEFLKELRDQKFLRYLSLRGISRISELPLSIFRLENLEILDLKACHNLETLPNDISSLTKLKHLDVSQCYLLERMPKGIEKLTYLKVLKGFVIGSPRKTPCRIFDLTNLEHLERLSIHKGSEAVIQENEFESMGRFSALTHLKISWGVSDIRYSDIQMNFPQSLEKLHLEGFPGEELPWWMPLTFKVLYITGGKLKTLHGHYFWPKVEIMRLKYLKQLKVDLKDLQETFPSLTYVEIKEIQNYAHIEWSPQPKER